MTLAQLFSQIPSAAYILFVIGLVFAMIEFFTPGFGFFGVTGIVSFLASIVVVMAAAGSLTAGIVFAVIVLVVIAALIIVFSVFASRGKFLKPLVLKEELTKEQGFSGVADYEDLKDKKGRSETILRPAGRANLDGKSYDVVTNGEFVPAGKPVAVVEIAGSRIVVKETKE